jgi:DNA-binding MarR family transcriptional regulator
MEANDTRQENLPTSKQNQRHEQLLPLMFKMGRLLKSEITRDGSSMPSFLHIETLRFIQEKEKAGQIPAMTDIADYLKIAPPSATALINIFVKEGMIERTTDRDDRRRVRLTISAKGEQLLEDTMQKRTQAFARVISSLSDEDCTELSRILTIITSSNS